MSPAPHIAPLPRLSRMFAADGRCLDVAIDHGTFGVGGFLDGIEDIHRTVDTLVAAAPDAIQLSAGQAGILQNRPGKKPALVVRTDVGNFYGKNPSGHLFSRLVDSAVERAVRLDAACVVVNLLALPGHPELFDDSVRTVVAVRALCDQVGMPVMVEPLAMKGGGGEGYDVDGDIDRIVPLIRQGIEMGADVIKADPSDHAEDYGAAVTAAGGRPLLVRGGGRVPLALALERTKAFIDAGASGYVYGRNVTQYDDPSGVTRALMSIVHDAASVDEALALTAAP